MARRDDAAGDPGVLAGAGILAPTYNGPEDRAVSVVMEPAMGLEPATC